MKDQTALTKILHDAVNAIAAGDTKAALQLLRENEGEYPDCKGDIAILSSRLARLGEDSMRGIMSYDLILLESNKIAHDIIFVLIPKIQAAIVGPASAEVQKPVGGADLLRHDFYPSFAHTVPFGHLLEDLFFLGKYDPRYPIHGPNVVRFALALFDNEKGDAASGLYKATEDGPNPHKEFGDHYPFIKNYLIEKGDKSGDPNEKEASIRNLLLVAALYHDIGKSIKNAKHPEIGANLIRNYDETERLKLMSFLGSADGKDGIENLQNRFNLLTSIVQHHDKFGVVSTGEGAPPIFSDILYFASNKEHIPAIKKNVTAVMLLNLADIAAVNTASHNKIKKAAGHAEKIKAVRIRIAGGNFTEDDVEEEKQLTNDLLAIGTEEKSCLGLSLRKIKNVIHDWNDLIEAIEATEGSKLALKEYLLRREKTPSRTIERILRLVEESVITAEAGELVKQEHLSRVTVESTLVSTLGTYQFLSFCAKYATVVKLDYGLRFFQSLVCACVRRKIHPLNYEEKHHEAFERDEENNRPTKSADRLSDLEIAALKNLDANDKNQLARKITSLTIKVLAAIISRYSSIFDANSESQARFGLEMGDLSSNNQVWRSLIKQLCLDDDKESFAMSWMIDEVTIWSLD